MKQFFNNHKQNPYFWIFLIFAVILFFLIPILSRDAGNSGDEDGFQVPQGRNVKNYFKTDGADSTCITFDNLRFYGSSPDVIMQYVNDAFGVEDIHITRHYFFSFFGWLAILMAGLIAYLIAGWRAGVLTMLLLFLSPRFLGHSFNNPKDIPFAAAIVASIFFMMRFLKQFPKVKWHTALALVLSIALGFSIRSGAFIIFGYFGLFGFCYLIKIYLDNQKALKIDKKSIKNPKKVKKSKFFDKLPFSYIWKMLLFGVGICVLGVLGGIVLWPYAQQSPVKHIIEAFREMSHFSISIRQIFEGTFIYGTNDIPWYYLPKWIFISSPIIVLVGFILNLILLWKEKSRYFWQAIVLFTAIFPIFWIVVTKANVYGGWRHVLFAYPTFVVAAGLGIDAAISLIERKLANKNALVNIISGGVILLTLWHPIRHIFNNHPYEYIYFNELFGGAKNAYGNYEMDYYYNSTREASEWILANAEPKADGSKTVVGTFHSASVNYFFRKDTADFKVSFIRWNERNNKNWDYAIFTLTAIDPDYLKHPLAFPPKNCVHTISVDEQPICLILKRADFNDLKAWKMLQEQQIDSAIFYYNEALAADPYNGCLLSHLVNLYFSKRDMESAKALIDRLLDFSPRAYEGNYALCQYYIVMQDYEKVLELCKKNREWSPKVAVFYYMAVEIYMQRNDLKVAENVLLSMVDASAFDNKTVEKLIQIYMAQGQTWWKAFDKAMSKMMERAPDKMTYDYLKKLYENTHNSK